MKMKIRSLISGIMIFSLLLLVGSSCKKETPPSPPDTTLDVTKDQNLDKLILKINEKSFTNRDFENFVKIQYPDVAMSTVAANQRLITRIFDSFTEHKVLGYLANKTQIAVDDLEFSHYLSKRLSVSSANIDRQAIIEAIKVQKYLDYTVYNDVKVEEKEINDYYNQHRDEFQKKEQVLLFQILVKDRATAVRIKAALDSNPQKFEDIARSESIAMEAKSGGMMGYFEKGTLPTDMENVVFALNPDTISPVLESTYGFHIFKITKKKKAQTQYLQDVRSEIENKLLSEKLSQAYQQFLAKNKQELSIQIFRENIHIKKLPAQEKDEAQLNEEINESTGDQSTTPEEPQENQ